MNNQSKQEKCESCGMLKVLCDTVCSKFGFNKHSSSHSKKENCCENCTTINDKGNIRRTTSCLDYTCSCHSKKEDKCKCTDCFHNAAANSEYCLSCQIKDCHNPQEKGCTDSDICKWCYISSEVHKKNPTFCKSIKL